MSITTMVLIAHDEEVYWAAPNIKHDVAPYRIGASYYIAIFVNNTYETFEHQLVAKPLAVFEVGSEPACFLRFSALINCAGITPEHCTIEWARNNPVVIPFDYELLEHQRLACRDAEQFAEGETRHYLYFTNVDALIQTFMDKLVTIGNDVASVEENMCLVNDEYDSPCVVCITGTDFIVLPEELRSKCRWLTMSRKSMHGDVGVLSAIGNHISFGTSIPVMTVTMDRANIRAEDTVTYICYFEEGQAAAPWVKERALVPTDIAVELVDMDALYSVGKHIVAVPTAEIGSLDVLYHACFWFTVIPQTNKIVTKSLDFDDTLIFEFLHSNCIEV